MFAVPRIDTETGVGELSRLGRFQVRLGDNQRRSAHVSGLILCETASRHAYVRPGEPWRQLSVGELFDLGG